MHQDHQTIAQEGLRAFKRTTILGYEIPWNNFDFSYGAYVALEKRHIERKVAALARYASQQHRRYADPEYVWNLARVHGDQREPRVRGVLPGLPDRRLELSARGGGDRRSRGVRPADRSRAGEGASG